MKAKRDILFLCQYFYPEYVSSATLPYDTARALVKAGFSVSALCGYPIEYNKNSDVPSEEVHEGIKIRRLKYLQLKRSNFIGRLINYFSFTFAVLLKFLSLRNYKSIIVYSNPPVLPLIAAWASKLFKTKMIFVSYDVYPEMAHITKSIAEGSVISKMMSAINNVVFRRVNKVVALSNEMKRYLLRNRPHISERQVEVIPNWYEDKGVQDDSKSLSNPLFNCIKNDGTLVVSYFGNLGICQDLDTILEAIRNFKDDNTVKFLFAGHGNKMKFLKQTVEKEKLDNVKVFDFLHGQDFQDALNISDCFLVSLADGLTGLAVPSKTYSYMMAGKPIIAIIGQDSDIAKDLLLTSAGYALQVGQVHKLVSAITELRDRVGNRKTMGENCRCLFLKKYTKENCTQQYVSMISRIME